MSRKARSLAPSDIREILKYIGRDVISFAGGLPAPEVFPKEEVVEAVIDIMRDRASEALQYSVTLGIGEFRGEVRKFMGKHGIKARDDEEVMITVGSQEALDLIAMALIDPGDYVIVESPTYLAALQVFRFYDARIIGVPMDEEGMRVDILEERIRRIKGEGGRIKFIYVVPTGQNPTGITMSLERRKWLLEVASKYDLLIIEDDPYSYVYFEGEAPPRLKSLDNEGRVIYISTFSKILSPGLRLGWALCNVELLGHLEVLKQKSTLHTPTLNQFIALRLLQRGIIDKCIEKARHVYRIKRDVMLDALKAEMPDGVQWTRPSAGMFIWVTLPSQIDSSALLRISVEKYKVAFVPGHSFYPEEPKRNTLRLNFTYPHIEDIERGVERLSSAIREFTGKNH